MQCSGYLKTYESRFHLLSSWFAVGNGGRKTIKKLLKITKFPLNLANDSQPNLQFTVRFPYFCPLRRYKNPYFCRMEKKNTSTKFTAQTFVCAVDYLFLPVCLCRVSCSYVHTQIFLNSEFNWILWYFGLKNRNKENGMSINKCVST